MLESIFTSSLYSLFNVEEKAFTLRSEPITAVNFSNNQIPKSLKIVEQMFTKVNMITNGINKSWGEIIPNELAMFLTNGKEKIFSGFVINDNIGISDAKENISPKPQIHIKRKININCFFLFRERWEYVFFNKIKISQFLLEIWLDIYLI